MLSPIASGYREVYGFPIREETCAGVHRDRSAIRFIYSKRIFPFVDGIGHINFRILAETARTPGALWASWSPSRARVEKANGGGGGGTSSERKKGENESRAWPINHTFVGITLLYTLAFARSKGSPRAPFSPATRTLVVSLSSLALSFYPSFSLSHANRALIRHVNYVRGPRACKVRRLRYSLIGVPCHEFKGQP